MRPIFSMVVVALLFATTSAHPIPARAEAPDTVVDIGPAGAADVGHVDPDEQLALGQVNVSEANWARTPDAAAILEVLRSRQLARGDARLLDTIRAYCPRATGQAPSSLVRMKWISTLRLDASEPVGWRALNSHRALFGMLPIRWSSFEPLWRARLAEARDLLEHPPSGTCDAPPQHWGARTLDRTAIGWREVDCGATVNRFWRLPATRHARE